MLTKFGALMRLFLISIGTLVCVVLVLITIRFWGLSLPTYRFEHDFYKSIGSTPQEIRVFHSIKSANELVVKNSNLTFWVETYMTSDSVFVVDSHSNLNNLIFDLRKDPISPISSIKFKGRYLQNYSFAELRSLDLELLKLEDVLSFYSKNNFIISIKNNAENVHTHFISLVEKLKIEKQILIHSDYDIVIKSIKEERPLFTFGTTLSEMMRLKTFSTVFLTPAISIKGDALISKLAYKNRILVTESIIKEIRRRQKYVFLGPLNSPEEISEAKKLQPDGLILN